MRILGGLLLSLIFATSAVGEEISRDQWLQAGRLANQKVTEWLKDRSSVLQPDPVIFGPNLDGTYFYRLGPMSVFDRFSAGRGLFKMRDSLQQQGFPTLQIDEMTLANLTNNRARALAVPKSIRCAKHFPGGDEELELTEDAPVHYPDPQKIQAFLQPFYKVLAGPNPPTCIMLGHATYAAEAFGSQSKVYLGPLIGKVDFEKIPASLNPAIVNHLRAKMGFRGIVIDDWMKMGAAERFLESLNQPYSSALLALYIASYARINYMPGLSIDSIHGIAAEARKLDPAILKDWERQLNLVFADLLPHLKIKRDAKTFSFELKLAIMVSASYGFDKRYNDSLSQEERAKLVDIFIGASDPWNRTGVLVMMQRQLMIENLFGLSTLGLPKNVEDEPTWLNRILTDNKFKAAYASIQWDSNFMQALFKELWEN